MLERNSAATCFRQALAITGVIGEVFGVLCRGLAYCPLIKSGKRPMIGTARCCEGFPIYRSKSRACLLSTDSIASG